VRVDTASGSTAQFDNLDALTRLKGYVSALRRRWFLVAIPLVLGVALGWLSAPDAPGRSAAPGIIEAAPTYVRATHVLIDESQSADAGPSVNLAQAAYLVNTGEVPERVAAQLDLPVEEVSQSMIGLPRAQVSSVEVQAIGEDEDLVVQLADGAAAQLIVTLATQAQADADSERDRILGQLEKLDTDISALNQQIVADPPNRSQLEAQQRSLTNQYSLVYEQFSQLANRPPPTAGLATLETAKPTEISEEEYEATKKTIREGADYVTGAVTTSVPETGESSAPGRGPSTPTRAGLGGIVGLGMGVGLVLLLDRFDSRLRRREDVEAATGLAVVAEIPPLTRHQQNTLEVVANTQHRSRAAEAYRVVRGAVLFALATDGESARSEGATVLMVTSANPAEGKTTTVANLAAVLAEGGFNVLVINCDFRRPRVHKYLLAVQNKDDPPFTEVARFGSVVVTNTNLDRVRLITGLGEDDPEANPLDVVALQRKIIQATRANFDMILLDTAPFLTTNDASELLSETDRVLLVVRGGKTKVEAAHRTSEILERFDAPVLGVVMNDSSEAELAQYYYAGYATSRSDKRGRSDSLREPGRGGEANGNSSGTHDPPGDRPMARPTNA